jgi:8-oxo-dGTP diphosphatase
MKKYYVVGFLFSENYEKVVLIKKSKPEWQKGLFNGVGGKMELDDASPLDAQIREFKEEAGVEITDWQEFLKIEGDNSVIYFFRAIGDVELVSTIEDKGEEVVVHNVDRLLNKLSICVPNIRWILPLALTNDEFKFKGQINIS